MDHHRRVPHGPVLCEYFMLQPTDRYLVKPGHVLFSELDRAFGHFAARVMFTKLRVVLELEKNHI